MLSSPNTCKGTKGIISKFIPFLHTLAFKKNYIKAYSQTEWLPTVTCKMYPPKQTEKSKHFGSTDNSGTIIQVSFKQTEQLMNACFWQ